MNIGKQFTQQTTIVAVDSSKKTIKLLASETASTSVTRYVLPEQTAELKQYIRINADFINFSSENGKENVINLMKAFKQSQQEEDTFIFDIYSNLVKIAYDSLNHYSLAIWWKFSREIGLTKLTNLTNEYMDKMNQISFEPEEQPTKLELHNDIVRTNKNHRALLNDFQLIVDPTNQFEHNVNSDIFFDGVGLKIGKKYENAFIKANVGREAYIEKQLCELKELVFSKFNITESFTNRAKNKIDKDLILKLTEETPAFFQENKQARLFSIIPPDSEKSVLRVIERMIVVHDIIKPYYNISLDSMILLMTERSLDEIVSRDVLARSTAQDFIKRLARYKGPIAINEENIASAIVGANYKNIAQYSRYFLRLPLIASWILTMVETFLTESKKYKEIVSTLTNFKKQIDFVMIYENRDLIITNLLQNVTKKHLASLNLKKGEKAVQTAADLQHFLVEKYELSLLDIFVQLPGSTYTVKNFEADIQKFISLLQKLSSKSDRARNVEAELYRNSLISKKEGGKIPEKWQLLFIKKVEEGKSILTITPTSGGKTYTAMTVLSKQIKSSIKRKIIYIAPSFDVAFQTYANIKASFETVNNSFSLITSRISKINAEANVWIGTPIEMMAYFKSINNTSYDIGYFDEIHTLSLNYDDDLMFKLRAEATWELIKMCKDQLIGLSATIKDEDVAKICKKINIASAISNNNVQILHTNPLMNVTEADIQELMTNEQEHYARKMKEIETMIADEAEDLKELNAQIEKLRTKLADRSIGTLLSGQLNMRLQEKTSQIEQYNARYRQLKNEVTTKYTSNIKNIEALKDKVWVADESDVIVERQRKIPQEMFRWNGTELIPETDVSSEVKIDPETTFRMCRLLIDKKLTPSIFFDVQPETCWDNYVKYVDWLEKNEAYEYRAYHAIRKKYEPNIDKLREEYFACEKLFSDSQGKAHTKIDGRIAALVGENRQVCSSIMDDLREAIKKAMINISSYNFTMAITDDEMNGSKISDTFNKFYKLTDIGKYTVIEGNNYSVTPFKVGDVLPVEIFDMVFLYNKLDRIRDDSLSIRPENFSNFTTINSTFENVGYFFRCKTIVNNVNNIKEMISNSQTRTSGEIEKLKTLFTNNCISEKIRIRDVKPLFETIVKGLGFGIGIVSPTLPFVIHYEMLKLISEKAIDIVFATMDFSMGVNYPIKSVCIRTNNLSNVNLCEYVQAAGRAGRWGEDTKGTVISWNIANSHLAVHGNLPTVNLGDISKTRGYRINGSHHSLAALVDYIRPKSSYQKDPLKKVIARYIEQRRETKTGKEYSKSMKKLTVEPTENFDMELDEDEDVVATSKDDVEKTTMRSELVLACCIVHLLPICKNIGFEDLQSVMLLTRIQELALGISNPRLKEQPYFWASKILLLKNSIQELHTVIRNSANVELLEHLEDVHDMMHITMLKQLRL